MYRSLIFSLLPSIMHMKSENGCRVSMLFVDARWSSLITLGTSRTPDTVLRIKEVPQAIRTSSRNPALAHSISVYESLAGSNKTNTKFRSLCIASALFSGAFPDISRVRFISRTGWTQKNLVAPMMLID